MKRAKHLAILLLPLLLIPVGPISAQQLEKAKRGKLGHIGNHFLR